MESTHPARVLVVAHKTAGTPALLEAIRARAQRSAAEFQLLVPNPAASEFHPLHPERHRRLAEGREVLSLALPLITQASGAHATGSVSVRHDPMDAIEETLFSEPVDEILVDVPTHRIASLLHQDLEHRLAHLGIPVVAVRHDHP
jgi:hypothetical protein